MNATYLRIDTLRILRNVMNLVFTIGLPVFMYLIFSRTVAANYQLPGGNGELLTAVHLAAYAGCTATTAIGALTAWERQQGWNRQLLLTPISPVGFAIQKVLTALLVAGVPVLAILALAAATGAKGTTSAWVVGGLVSWLGSALFALYGLLLALVIRSDAAIGIATGTLVIFGFLGNVFIPLSGRMLEVAMFTPLFGIAMAADRPITHGRTVTGVEIAAWAPWATMGVWLVVLMALTIPAMQRSGAKR